MTNRNLLGISVALLLSLPEFACGDQLSRAKAYFLIREAITEQLRAGVDFADEGVLVIKHDEGEERLGLNVTVTGITRTGDSTALVLYEYELPILQAPVEIREEGTRWGDGQATLQLYDDGWRVVHPITIIVKGMKKP